MRLATGPPSLDPLAITRVGGAKSGSQGGFLVRHHEQVRNEHEGGTVAKERPGFIEKGRPGQGEARTKVHRVANEQIGPATTRRRGGSNGAGVPRPITMKVTMHHSARTAPLAPTTAPATCGAPMLTGSTIPDHERMRAGKNTSKKPIKRAA